MININQWTTLRSLRFFTDKALAHPNESLVRYDWAVDPRDDTSQGHNQGEVDSIYAEIISKIPVGATKVLEIGCGGGQFYQALKAAKPGLGYRGIDLVSESITDAQTAKGTISVAGVLAADTVTIGGVALTASGSQTASGLNFDESITQATATIIVASVQAADFTSIRGIKLTASGSQTASGLDFNEAAGTNILVADSLVAAINDPGNGLSPYVTADNGGGTSATVTLTAVAVGSEGDDDAPLLSSGATLTLSGYDLTGGIGGDVETATSLVAAINDPGNALAVTADNDGGTSATVTLRAKATGTAANLITLTSSDGTRLAASAATLGNGVDAGVFEIGNAWEYLSEATVDWDFVVSIHCLFSCDDDRDPELLFDLLDSKSPKGFFVLADKAKATPALLAAKMPPALATSTVTESYHEGARVFLVDALVKNMFPFYVHRGSTSATPPTLPARYCPIATGHYNRTLGREVSKRAGLAGSTLPANFTGITATGGLVTGQGTVAVDPRWVSGVKVRPQTLD